MRIPWTVCEYCTSLSLSRPLGGRNLWYLYVLARVGSVINACFVRYRFRVDEGDIDENEYLTFFDSSCLCRACCEVPKVVSRM